MKYVALLFLFGSVFAENKLPPVSGDDNFSQKSFGAKKAILPARDYAQTSLTVFQGRALERYKNKADDSKEMPKSKEPKKEMEPENVEMKLEEEEKEEEIEPEEDLYFFRLRKAYIHLSSQAADLKNLPAEYKALSRSVFRVFLWDDETSSVGTGFLIKENFFITNFHVVGDFISSPEDYELIIVNSYGHILKIKRVKDYSEKWDLALLEVEPRSSFIAGKEDRDTRGHPVFKISPQKIKNGDKIYTTGYLNGQLISYKSSVKFWTEEGIAFNLDHYNNKGMSGSPLINAKGELVGVIHGVRIYSLNVGFVWSDYTFIETILKFHALAVTQKQLLDFLIRNNLAEPTDDKETSSVGQYLLSQLDAWFKFAGAF